MLNDLKSLVEPWSQSTSTEEVKVPTEEAPQLDVNVYVKNDKDQIKKNLDLQLFIWVWLM